MNYFEDWYSQPIDNEEEDQEKRLASLLQAAADAPTGGPDYEPQDNFSSASDQAGFNAKSGIDLIQQIVNRNVADINLGLGDTKDLPSTSEWSADLFERPADAVDDLDFFDRKAPVNSLLDLAGRAPADDDFWQGFQKGSGEVAEMPKINLAASDLANWLVGDKNPKITDGNNPENPGVPSIQELMPTWQERQKIMEELAQEERNKRFSRPTLDNLPKPQSFDDWFTEKAKPILDWLPKKADGSPDWPSINADVMTADRIAQAKKEWSQNEENQGKEWDRSVKRLGNFRGQDYYLVYKFDVRTRPIQILQWDTSK